MTDPDTDRRFWALSAEAHRLGEVPTPGETEVTRLAEIVEQMCEILDNLPEVRLARLQRRFHQPRGRAVDFLPKSPFPERPSLPPGREPYGRSQHYDHDEGGDDA